MDEGRVMVIMCSNRKLAASVMEGSRGVVGEEVREATGGGENPVEGAVAQQAWVPKSLHKCTNAAPRSGVTQVTGALTVYIALLSFAGASLAGFTGEPSCRG